MNRGLDQMITYVLPAYNEAFAIPRLLTRIAQESQKLHSPIRTIVVDDGSQDETAENVRRFASPHVKLIQHARNSGLSAAMRTGLQAAAEMSAPDDVIITMDADDSHPPAFARPMSELIDQGYDIVVASRYCEGSRVRGVPRSRILLSRGAGVLFKLLFPLEGIRDYTCGFRAYRAGLIQRGFAHWGDRFIDQPGFSCMVDLLLKLSVFNPQFVEVPFILRYDRKPGLSKMQVGRTVRETLTLMLRRRLTLQRESNTLLAAEEESLEYRRAA
jgi:dolichol-phosphate mannosyltransferase